MEQQIFKLKDGRNTACDTFELFEWLITDFEIFEEQTRDRLKDIRRSLRELRKMKASAKGVFGGGTLLIARKTGADLAGEGIKDNDLLGLVLHLNRGEVERGAQ